MKGAIEEPILATVEQDPTPTFLATVGNISAENIYTIEKLAELNILPVIAKAVCTPGNPRKI